MHDGREEPVVRVQVLKRHLIVALDQAARELALRDGLRRMAHRLVPHQVDADREVDVG